MFCTQCGTQLADGTKFCTHCGKPTDTPLVPQTAPAQYAPPPPYQQTPPQYRQTAGGPVRQKNILPVVLIAAAAVVVIAVLASRGSSPSGIRRGNAAPVFIQPPNPLRNTAWEMDLGSMANDLGALFGLSFDATITWTFVFSDTGYTETIQQIAAGLNLGTASGTGAYTISGDTVTLTADDGDQRAGTLTGGSLTIDDVEFIRIR